MIMRRDDDCGGRATAATKSVAFTVVSSLSHPLILLRMRRRCRPFGLCFRLSGCGCSCNCVRPHGKAMAALEHVCEVSSAGFAGQCRHDSRERTLRDRVPMVLV